MNIWILDSDSGVTLLYKSYMDIPINEDLVSGLLTALNQFTIMEFKQGLESIDMGGLRWVYIMDKESNLLFVAAGPKDVNAEMLRARLNVIKQAFIQDYFSEQQQVKKKWDGNVERYRPFKQIIDQFYTDWLAAESVTSIAEFVDILGIFQQLFFDLLSILHKIPDQSQEIIYDEIEKMFENYKNNEYVKKNPELSKINFARDTGINIITINPNNCDMIVVEKQIINLLRRVLNSIKNEIGHTESLRLFNEENILNYILNNIDMLHKLNLDKFLLQLFLLE
ncbi:MAG: hypothetical protein ACFFDK_08035 [Promethearchaeota archaeon]